MGLSSSLANSPELPSPPSLDEVRQAVLAHDPALQPASDAFALAFLLLVLLLTLAVASFALVLRHRARHPRPEAEWIEELSRAPSPVPDTQQASPRQDTWERQPDWWKAPPR